jgi:hypothetical protein
MTRILADDLLRSKLNNLAEKLEICDADGNILGFFVPADNDKDLYRDIRLPAHVTPEEIGRRIQQGGGRSLAEIWKDLGRT